MELESFIYSRDSGWSINQFPPMDSENTVIIVLSNISLPSDSGPLVEISNFYPNSKIIGYSGTEAVLGEFLLGNSIPLVSILDHHLLVTVIRFNNTKTKLKYLDLKANNNVHLFEQSILEEAGEEQSKGVFIFSNSDKMGAKFNKMLSEHLHSNSCVFYSTTKAQGLKKYWVMSEGEIKENAAFAIVFQGNRFHLESDFKRQSLMEYAGDTPVLALGQFKHTALSQMDEECAIEDILTYLPTQTKLIGFHSVQRTEGSQDLLYAPLVFLYEDIEQKTDVGELNAVSGKEIAHQMLTQIKRKIAHTHLLL